jgi:ribosomal protein S18 acetylase RimI-like enzyme
MDIAVRVAGFFPEAWRRRALSIGGTVHEVDGLVVALTGVAFAPFNATMVERLPADPAAALAAARAAHAVTGLAFGLDLDPVLHAPVRDAAVDAGLTVVESRPAMTLDVDQMVEPPAPEGLWIRRVEDPAGLDAVADVDHASFGGDRALVRAFVGDGILADPSQRAYVATLDGQPVACAETASIGRTLGVFGVATIPEARRRGIGAAITAFAIRDRASEADLAVLQASDLGSGVYERLGFRTVSTWEVWGTKEA